MDKKLNITNKLHFWGCHPWDDNLYRINEVDNDDVLVMKVMIMMTMVMW